MSFLTLNGIAWKVGSSQSAQLKVNEIGWRGRMIDGSFAATRRAIKRSYKFKTIPLSPVDALALKNALLGLGNHWSFDGSGTYLYSDKGLQFDATSGTSRVTSGPSPKFGAGCLKILSGDSVTTLRGTTDQTGTEGMSVSWVVWFWNGSSWDGYAGSWTGGSFTNCYKNGSSVSLPGFVSLSSGLNLFGKNAAGTNADAYFDDLVVLPYVARPADLAAWSQATAAFSALPQLTAAGDVIESPWLGPCYGSIEEADPLTVNTGDGGGLYDNGQQVSFSIEEA